MIFDQLTTSLVFSKTSKWHSIWGRRETIFTVRTQVRRESKRPTRSHLLILHQDRSHFVQSGNLFLLHRTWKLLMALFNISFLCGNEVSLPFWMLLLAFKLNRFLLLRTHKSKWEVILFCKGYSQALRCGQKPSKESLHGVTIYKPIEKEPSQENSMYHERYNSGLFLTSSRDLFIFFSPPLSF